MSEKGVRLDDKQKEKFPPADASYFLEQGFKTLMKDLSLAAGNVGYDINCSRPLLLPWV